METKLKYEKSELLKIGLEFISENYDKWLKVAFIESGKLQLWFSKDGKFEFIHQPCINLVEIPKDDWDYCIICQCDHCDVSGFFFNEELQLWFEEGVNNGFENIECAINDSIDNGDYSFIKDQWCDIFERYINEN